MKRNANKTSQLTARNQCAVNEAKPLDELITEAMQ